MSVTQRPGPARRRQLLGPIEIAILLLGLAVLMARLYTVDRMSRLSRDERPLLQAIDDARFEATLAHLGLERWLAGDRDLDLGREVFGRIDRAQALAAGLATTASPDRSAPAHGPQAELAGTARDLAAALAGWRAEAEARVQAGAGDPASLARENRRSLARIQGLAASARRNAAQIVAGHERVIERLSIGSIVVLVALFAIAFGLARWYRQQLEAQTAALERRVDERTAALQATLRLQQAILAGSDYAIIATRPDGIIQSFNPAAERMLGYRAEELVGRATPEVFHDRDELNQRAKELSLELGRPLEPGFEVFVARTRSGTADEREWTYVARDGRRFPVMLSVTALYDDDGSLAGYLGIARDVTSERRARAELLHARDAAEAASRAKSQFLAGMSHELRTPLNSVIGFANLLRRNRDGRLGEQELGYIGRIVDNGRHLLGLINDILDLSKIEAGKFNLELGPVDLLVLVRQAAAEIEPQARDKGLELRVELPERLWPVVADAIRLKQILFNLLGNAIKFTDRGLVAIRVESDPAGRALALAVSDTGIGIAADRIGRIFESFEQADSGTSRRYGGSGLGLALSRGLAEAMGFSLGVTSDLGHGSTFRLRLVRGAPAESRPWPEADALPPFSAAAYAGRVALVVDDDPDARELLAAAVAECGLQILTAASAEQALALVRNRPVDLILTDLYMPGRSGWDLLRDLKADPALSAIPVVVASAAGRDRGAIVLGALDCLAKPIERPALEQVLARVVGGSRGRALVADDDPDSRRILAALLAELGFSAVIARDGLAALEAVRSFLPDVILLDLAMPGLGGADTLAALRRDPRLAGVPVIVVTASDGAAGDNWTLRRQADAILHKDASLGEQLPIAIRRALSRPG